MLKKFMLALMVFTLGACSSSDDNGGGGGGGGGNVCEAATEQDFFQALSGSESFAAVDTFVENGNPATADDTFVDGQTYSVSFDGASLSLTIPTENGDETFTFGDEEDDIYEVAEIDGEIYEINARMIRGNVRLLIQQPCDDSGDTLFISYSDEAGNQPPFPPSEFFWRLDAVE